MSELIEIEDVRSPAASVLREALRGLMNDVLVKGMAEELADKIVAKLAGPDAKIIDGSGDEWARDTSEITYTFVTSNDVASHKYRRWTRSEIKEHFGIQETP